MLIEQPIIDVSFLMKEQVKNNLMMISKEKEVSNEIIRNLVTQICDMSLGITYSEGLMLSVLNSLKIELNDWNWSSNHLMNIHTLGEVVLEQEFNENLNKIINVDEHFKKFMNSKSFYTEEYIDIFKESIGKYIPKYEDMNGYMTASLIMETQSGKTGMVSLLSMSMMKYYEKTLIIDLTVSNDSLLNQGIERVREAARGFTREEISTFEIEDLKKVPNKVVKSLNSSRCTYINAQKNVSQLNKIKQFLKKNKDILEANKIVKLIIDDEGDIGGINTKKEDKETDPTKISELIYNLIHEVLEEKTFYINVSATPFAVLASRDSNYSIAPNTFMSYIPPHTNYFGTKDLFDENGNFRGIDFDKEELTSIEGFEPKLFEVLVAYISQVYISKYTYKNIDEQELEGLNDIEMLKKYKVPKKTLCLLSNIIKNPEQEYIQEKVESILEYCRKERNFDLVSSIMKKYIKRLGFTNIKIDYDYLNQSVIRSIVNGYNKPFIINQNWKKQAFDYNNTYDHSICIGGQSVARGLSFDNLTLQMYYNGFNQEKQAEDTFRQTHRFSGPKKHFGNFILVACDEMTIEYFRESIKFTREFTSIIDKTKTQGLNSFFDTLLFADLKLLTSIVKMRNIIRERNYSVFSKVHDKYNSYIPSISKNSDSHDKFINHVFLGKEKKEHSKGVSIEVNKDVVVDYLKNYVDNNELLSALEVYDSITVGIKTTKNQNNSRYLVNYLQIVEERGYKKETYDKYPVTIQGDNLQYMIKNDKTCRYAIEKTIPDTNNYESLSKYVEQPIITFHRVKTKSECGSEFEFTDFTISMPKKPEEYIEENRYSYGYKEVA